VKKSETRKYTLCVEDIKIEIIRKQIKNMHLYVLPPDGKVRLTAPKTVSEKVISDFILSKIDWIKKHRNKFAEMPKEKDIQYVSGETVVLWGKEFRLEVIEYEGNRCYGKSGGILAVDDRLIIRVPSSCPKEKRERLVMEWYRDNLKAEIPQLLNKWQRIIGVKAEEWGVRFMKTRWGTCNIKDRRIWLNLRLAQKPPECLEYVLVHELVHLLERRHSHEFKNYMKKFLPGWEETKALLNGRNIQNIK